MELDDNGNIKIKVILVGDAGVGKTSLIKVTIGKDFNEEEKSTIYSTFSIKTIQINKKKYNLYIWDTMGQEKLKSLTKIFFKNSKIVVLVYDITKKESFNGLVEYWIKEVKDSLGDDIIIGICGNKSDLYLKEQVKEEECIEFAKNINARWVVTSAKADRNGFTIFLKDLLKDFIKLFKRKQKEGKNNTKEYNKKIILNNTDEKKQQKQQNNCC